MARLDNYSLSTHVREYLCGTLGSQIPGTLNFTVIFESESITAMRDVIQDIDEFISLFLIHVAV